MTDLSTEGMTITPGVVETIVTLAVKDVDGVVSVGNPPADLLRAVLHGMPNTQGVDVSVDDDGKMTIAVHVNIAYGKPIPLIAQKVREHTVDAVTSQIGTEIARVDVYVDGIRFHD